MDVTLTTSGITVTVNRPVRQQVTVPVARWLWHTAHDATAWRVGLQGLVDQMEETLHYFRVQLEFPGRMPDRLHSYMEVLEQVFAVLHTLKQEGPQISIRHPKWKTGVVHRLELQLRSHRDDVLAVMGAADMENLLQRFEKTSIRRRAMYWLNLSDENTIYPIRDIQTWVTCAKARVTNTSMMVASDGINRERVAREQQQEQPGPSQRVYSRFSRSEGEVVITPTEPNIFGQARRVSRKVRAHVLALELVRNMHGGPYHPKPENAQPKVQTTMATQTEPEGNREEQEPTVVSRDEETTSTKGKGKGKGKSSARTRRQKRLEEMRASDRIGTNPDRPGNRRCDPRAEQDQTGAGGSGRAQQGEASGFEGIGSGKGQDESEAASRGSVPENHSERKTHESQVLSHGTRRDTAGQLVTGARPKRGATGGPARRGPGRGSLGNAGATTTARRDASTARSGVTTRVVVTEIEGPRTRSQGGVEDQGLPRKPLEYGRGGKIKSMRKIKSMMEISTNVTLEVSKH